MEFVCGKPRYADDTESMTKVLSTSCGCRPGSWRSAAPRPCRAWRSRIWNMLDCWRQALAAHPADPGGRGALARDVQDVDRLRRRAGLLRQPPPFSARSPAQIRELVDNGLAGGGRYGPVSSSGAALSADPSARRHRGTGASGGAARRCCIAFIRWTSRSTRATVLPRPSASRVRHAAHPPSAMYSFH